VTPPCATSRASLFQGKQINLGGGRGSGVFWWGSCHLIDSYKLRTQRDEVADYGLRGEHAVKSCQLPGRRSNYKGAPD